MSVAHAEARLAAALLVELLAAMAKEEDRGDDGAEATPTVVAAPEPVAAAA